jgi:hypothetical protein
MLIGLVWENHSYKYLYLVIEKRTEIIQPNTKFEVHLPITDLPGDPWLIAAVTSPWLEISRRSGNPLPTARGSSHLVSKAIGASDR